MSKSEDAEKAPAEIATREFLIRDYDAALELWRRVEGIEIR